jgi:hypothetical protein
METECVEQERPGAKTLLEKTPHNGQIVDLGGQGKPPVVVQVVAKGPLQHVKSTFLTYWDGQQPCVTQLSEEAL